MAQGQTPQEPQGTYSTSGTDHACGAFSYSGSTFASAFSALAAYTHACPYLASVSEDTCTGVTVVQARFNGSCAYIYTKTSQGGGDRIGGLINWTVRCPEQTTQNSEGMCVPEPPTLIELAGPTSAVPQANGGQALRLVVTVTKNGAPQQGVSISISMQGEAGGTVTGAGTTDAGGKAMLDYTPPHSLVGAARVDKLRADCGVCSNSAHLAISVQGTPAQPAEEGADDPGQCTRHPIVATSGTKVYSHTDLNDAGAHPVGLTRRYASRWDVAPAAGLGSHWAHQHAHRVIMLGRQAIVQYGDGAGSRFENTAPSYSHDPAMGGTWRCAPRTWCTPAYIAPPQQPPAQWTAQGSADTMAQTPAGIEVRRARDDSQWVFDKTTGQALSWRQRNGWTYSYSYTGAVLTKVTNAFGRSLSLTYNAQGQLTGATSAGGQSVAYGYDAAGRLAQVSQTGGTTRGYLYEDARWPNAVTAVVNEAGERHNQVAYDAQGRAVLSELAGGAGRTRISYGASGTAITDALNMTRTYQYQGAPGRGLRTTQASAPEGGNSVAGQTLDGHGLLQSQVDYLGITTLFTWDVARRLQTSETHAAGRPEAQTTQTLWHPQWRLPVMVTQEGRTTAFTYDERGNKTSETVTDTATGQARTWAWHWGARGLMVRMTEPGGGVWRYAYGPMGLPDKQINPLGQETAYGWDAAGRLVSIERNTLAPQAFDYDALGRVTAWHVGQGATRNSTLYSWTVTGQLQSVAQPGGHMVRYGYDAAQRLISAADNRGNTIQYTLDAMGNRLREEIRDNQGAIARLTARAVSGLNQVVAVQGASGQTTQLGYDANGQAISQTDPLNQTTRQALDGLKRPVATTFADNAVARQSWNLLDQLTQVSDPNGVQTRYTYNAFGEVITEVSPDAGTTHYERDANGRVVKQTDARGQVTLITRDALGRPVHIDRGGAHQTYYTWDTQRTGYLAKVEDPSGATEYQYDPKGKLTARTQRVNDNPANPSAYTIRHAYGRTQLTALTYPSGLVVHYRRDATGQITQLDTQVPGGAASPFVKDLVHTALDQPKAWTWWNADKAERTYDADARMVANEFASYTYDAASRITGITQQLWTRTTASAQITPMPLSWTVEYDRRDRLTGFKRDGAGASYTYDPNSNRLTAIESARADVDLEGEFDSPNQGKTTSQALRLRAGTNRLMGFTQTQSHTQGTRTLSTASTSVTYTVDAAGNLTSDGLRQYRYDAANRMDRVRIVRDGETANIDYLHNAQGQRVFKSEPEALRTLPNADTFSVSFIDWLKKQFGWLFTGSTTASIGTAYVYGDGPLPAYALLGEYDNGSASGAGRTEYIYLPMQDGGALLMGMYRNGKLFAVHTDHLGTPRLITNDNNKPVWQWPYSAFGTTEPTGTLIATPRANRPPALKRSEPAQKFSLRYEGQTADPETNTFQNRWRNFSPDRGRYDQMDRIGLGGGLNRTVYGNQNSLRYTDPNGLSARILAHCVGKPAACAAAAAAMAQAAVSACKRTYDIVRDWMWSEGAAAPAPADEKAQSGDRQALGEIIRDETNGGRKPVSNSDADTILDWARELEIPGARDDRGTSHWTGGDHIHVPGSGVRHIPVRQQK